MESSAKKSIAAKRKQRRGRRDSLGALSSLVSFDEPCDSTHGQEGELKVDDKAVKSTVQSRTAEDSALSRMVSEPYPTRTLFTGGIPSLRKTLSQDWLKVTFSPRPGKEPKRDMLLGTVCPRPERLLSSLPSLRSIPEENELDQGEGSELSDDFAPGENINRVHALPKLPAGDAGATNAQNGSSSDSSSTDRT